MTQVLIVESPKKAKTISAFLPGWKVVACFGHFRDLPKRAGAADNWGLNADMSPIYEVTKSEVVAKLKAATDSASRVVIASDPDREGEAIAWHVSQVIRNRRHERATFSSITPKEVQRALGQTRAIDASLVKAQEGRRVIDRLVGYRLSERISSASGGRASSAGRVQSFALALVVRRHRLITSFVPIHHIQVEAMVRIPGTDIEFSAVWDHVRHLSGEDKKAGHWFDRATAERVAARSQRLEVVSIDKSERVVKSPDPFTTSTLQQAASSRLDLSPEATMSAAQALFEAGLITYHRTDSPAIDHDADEELQRFLRSMGIEVDSARTFVAKESAQAAHECIRPTDVSVEKGGDTPEEKALYNLIRCRFLAARMTPAVYEVCSVSMEALDVHVRGQAVVFTAKGQAPKSAGWRGLYKEVDDGAADDEDVVAVLPALKEGQALQATCAIADKKTSPLRPYTEADLIRTLESEGVGRPSTYASILSSLKTRGFVRLEKKTLRPEPVGIESIDILESAGISIVNGAYTRLMEEKLDEIAASKGQSVSQYRALVSVTNATLDSEVKKIKTAAQPGLEHYQCCGAPMRLRTGAYGPFMSCSRYPECKVIKNLSEADALNAGVSKASSAKGAVKRSVVRPSTGSSRR